MSAQFMLGSPILSAPQKFEIATKLANPTRLVVDRRLNPTYDLSFRPTKWIPYICNLKVTRSKPFQPARWQAQQRNMNNEQGITNAEGWNRFALSFYMNKIDRIP
jgi:hypothetical protein